MAPQVCLSSGDHTPLLAVGARQYGAEMSDQPTSFPDARAYRAHELANPRGIDPLASLLPLVGGDTDRWARVGHHVLEREKDMGREQAVASVRADLEAGRL